MFSMIVSVAVSIVGGTTGYYVALGWTTAAIAYFEVKEIYTNRSNLSIIMV